MAQTTREKVRTTSARIVLRIESARILMKDVVRSRLADWFLPPPESDQTTRLAKLPIHTRALVAAFVMTMGLGYLSAMVQLHSTHADADGKPGLSRDDVVATFHGLPSRTRLAVQAQGAMREHLKSDDEMKALVAWCAAGAPKERFEDVHPILQQRCVVCHSKDGEKEDVPLVTFEDVKAQTKVEPLVSKRRLIALTHIHVLAMGGLFGLLGAVFCFTSYPSRWKLAIVLLPFMGMTLDFSGWWLTRLDARFADMILLGGALTGAGLGLLVVGALAEVTVLPWIAKRLA